MRRQNPPTRPTNFASMQSGGGIPWQPGIATPGSQLSASDIAYLQDRSLRFQQVLGDIYDLPYGHVLYEEEGRIAVARLAALALVGDDYNYATGQPSVGWNPTKWTAAYHLVKNNVLAWHQAAGGAHPPAPGPGGGYPPAPGPGGGYPPAPGPG
jgi:hypothetical protein